MTAAAGGRRIRVLVVEDSRFMRGVITHILAADPSLEVVGCAVDGREAVEAVATLAPDVVTMDVDMPRADGPSAVETIMAQFPTPVLMLSAYTGRNSAAALRALELGAVDCIAKPSDSVDLGLETVAAEIVGKVRMDAVTTMLRVDEGAVLPLPPAFAGRERRRFAGLLRRGDRVVPLLDVDGAFE